MVAVLFAHRKSVYKSIGGCDVYDIDRDARYWPGGEVIIAHPPCRAWGGLRQFAKPRDDEKALAPWAVDRIREYGGVLEHPRGSSLWNFCRLPKGSERDEWGGFTLQVDQCWWGHKARKSTWLYIVGCEPKNVPPIPLTFAEPEYVVAPSRRPGRGPCKHLPKSLREHTPVDFAMWLVKLADVCRPVNGARHAQGLGLRVHHSPSAGLFLNQTQGPQLIRIASC